MSTTPIPATYTIPKPKMSPIIYVLALINLIALIGIYMVSVSAFKLVAEEHQAYFLAGAVEAGAVIEAILLMRSRGWKKAAIPLIGVVAALIVSGTYNYVAVEHHGRANQITHPWQLTVFAVGPLLMMTFVSLTTGRVLRDYEDAVEDWTTKHQQWQDDQARAEQDRQDRLAAQERQDRLTREAAEQARLTLQAEQERQDRLAREAAERAAAEREQARRDKLAAQMERERIRAGLRKVAPESSPKRAESSPESSAAPVAVAGNLPEDSAAAGGEVPQHFRHVAHLRGNFPRDWRKLSPEQKRQLDQLSPAEIAWVCGLSDKTGRNWKATLAANGFHEPQAAADVSGPGLSQESLL
jgi:hypothetical protein